MATATVVDAETFERMVQNVMTGFRAADSDQDARGRVWYPTARQVATLLAEGNTEAGAGVLAALSPQKNWYLNQRLARQAFETGEARGNVGDAVRKAQRIMEGENPLEVLPEDSKSWNFYRNIFDPEDPDPVTIDRHAHDVALNEIYGSRERPLTKSKRGYALLAHVYREAARRLGELPNVVQAVTWVYWTETVLGDLPRRPGKRNTHQI